MLRGFNKYTIALTRIHTNRHAPCNNNSPVFYYARIVKFIKLQP